MPNDYNPLTKDSGTPTVPATQPPMRPPGDAPEAPDMATGALAGTPATSALGGSQAGPAAPHQPGVGERIKSFIEGGQGSPGSVWRGILSGALTGMTAGASQGRFGSGVAVGAQQELKQQQQKFENQQATTRQASEEKVRAATIAKMNHDITAESWDLSNRQNKATAEHAAAENAMVREVQAGGEGAKDLGVMKDANDLVALHKANPNLLVDQMRGNIFTVPHFTEVLDKDGKPTGEQQYDGVRAFYIPPEYLAQKIDKDISIPMFKPGEKGQPGTWEPQLFQAGTITNKDKLQLMGKQSELSAKYDNDTAVAKATELAARAQAELAKGAKTAQDAEQLKTDASTLGSQYFSGDAAPSQTTRDPKLKRAALAEAERLSMEKFHTHFNQEDAEAFYKSKSGAIKNFTTGADATTTQAFNTAIAHLDLLGQASQLLGGGKSPELNAIANRLGVAVGKSDMATYNAIHEAVLGEVGSVYKKGVPTEGGEQRLSTVFNANQGPEAAPAAIKATIDLMLGKLQAQDNTFRNATRGKAPSEYGINIISPESREVLNRLGVQIPAKLQQTASTGFGSTYQMPSGPTPTEGYKVGDTITQNGQTYKVTKVENGKVTGAE